MVLLISGCTQIIPNQNDDITIDKIEYKTYGGFTLIETNKQTITINSNSINYVLSSYDDVETFRYSSIINKTNFTQLLTLLNDNGFNNWAVNQTSNINVADVGVAEITVFYSNGTNKTVKFDPNVPYEYGTDKENVLNKLNEYSSTFFEKYLDTLNPLDNSTQDNSNIVEIKFQPMQCDQNPWDDWYSKGDIKFIKEPTSEELIIAYYSSKQINIVNIQKVQSDLFVCEACSVCPTSYYYIAETDIKYLKSLDGWILI